MYILIDGRKNVLYVHIDGWMYVSVCTYRWLDECTVCTYRWSDDTLILVAGSKKARI